MTFDRPKRTKRDLVDPDSAAAAVFVLSDRHSSLSGPWHRHRRLQLLHVSEGVLTVETETARFVIPPQRAVWIPPGRRHRIFSSAPFWLTTCYMDHDRVGFCPPTEIGVTIDRLTDALLVAVAAFAAQGPASPQEARKLQVLVDCLAELPAFDVVLPLPLGDRLRRLTRPLMIDPAHGAPLAELAREAGVTERTAARLFKAETGLSFGAWRLQLRLQSALGHLSEGRSVTETAFSVGYRDVSSFITAFKDHFGRTPSQMRLGRS
ncbi:helix-turn-helix transcriptional regulator [Pseudooceanicola albus]|nr:helix-turn-helix transcriptional regulator [Pseudooceanicola albus]